MDGVILSSEATMKESTPKGMFDRPTDDPCAWCAPEHYHVALYMERNRYGQLVIELHSIFAYSRENPPTWVAGNIRARTTR